ncbi:hypothetical protein V2J09_009932 [Rumex salicifolius]
MGVVSTVVSSPPPLPGGGAAEGGAGASDDSHQQQRWSTFDSSVNAVSFGFVATAILISMFLVMAIFERFLRPTSSDAAPRRVRRQGDDLDPGPPPAFQHLVPGFNPKLGFPSPKMTVYTKGVSVLMPGEEFPTYIAHPAPVPCPPEPIIWPQNQYYMMNPNRNSSRPPPPPPR